MLQNHILSFKLDLVMKQAARNKVKEATILVIVYEYIVRDILARILTAKGYRVVTCSVGFNGIRTFEKGKGKFHLVVIDMSLPGISGLGVAREIKRISQKTPVMLMKGWDEKLDEKELKDSGVDFILSKPFYMDKALDLVENAIQVAIQPLRLKGTKE